MANNVIDLDPTTRLTKEALERIKATINGFTIEDLDNFVLLYIDKEGASNFEAFGVDWKLMGIGQAYFEALRQELLYGPRELSEDE